MKDYIFSKGQKIGQYCIDLCVAQSEFSQVYYVTDSLDKTFCLKVFLEKHELLMLKEIHHANITRLLDVGEIEVDHQVYDYAILELIHGETLENKIKRDGPLSTYEAKNILLGILNGLQYLHGLEKPVFHNALFPRHIMLKTVGQIVIPQIINFRKSTYEGDHVLVSEESSDICFYSNEILEGNCSIASDIFSVGCLYYYMLTGKRPYIQDNLDIEILKKKRTLPLQYPSYISDEIQWVINRALHQNITKRYDQASSMLRDLYRFEGVTPVLSNISGIDRSHDELNSGKKEIVSSSENSERKYTTALIENEDTLMVKGFDAIVGMDSLKETLKLDVIDALKDIELYKEYGLTIPNGLLLYGPPGCGKTFFAEKLAEEIGFSFYSVSPSDIQSKWVNESQGNVKALFDEAREKAPSIIFIDEIDALMPSRDTRSMSHMNSAVVNEFLVQLNNCGKSNLFVIGATNRPQVIDKAILRSGRLDKHIYVPPPDIKAKTLMFEFYLKSRPIEDIDYTEIAIRARNFASSDIKFFCDEVARQALRYRGLITSELVDQQFSTFKPSLTDEVLREYESIIF